MALKLAVYGYDTDIGKLVIETLEEQHLPLDDFFPLSPLSGEYDAVMIDKRITSLKQSTALIFQRQMLYFFFQLRMSPQESFPWLRKKVV